MIKIFINGKEHIFEKTMSLTTLLESLNVKREGVAVAVNADVIPQKKYESVTVVEGDTVEIVRAVQGG